MAILDKLLEAIAIKLDSNDLTIKDVLPQYTAEYLLSLRELISDYGITNNSADLPIALAKAEARDRFWLIQLQEDAYGYSNDVFSHWLRRKSIAKHFGDITELPERDILQLNLADDLVLLFSEMRKLNLKRWTWDSFQIRADEWFSTEYERIREKHSEGAPSLQKASEDDDALRDSCVRLLNRYYSAKSLLDVLSETLVSTVVLNPDDRAELNTMFLHPGDESLLAGLADLRAKITPCRLLSEGSHPRKIRNILRSMEVGKRDQPSLCVLERELAEAYQRLYETLEVANGRDD